MQLSESKACYDYPCPYSSSSGILQQRLRKIQGSTAQNGTLALVVKGHLQWQMSPPTIDWQKKARSSSGPTAMAALKHKMVQRSAESSTTKQHRRRGRASISQLTQPWHSHQHAPLLWFVHTHALSLSLSSLSLSLIHTQSNVEEVQCAAVLPLLDAFGLP